VDHQQIQLFGHFTHIIREAHKFTIGLKEDHTYEVRQTYGAWLGTIDPLQYLILIVIVIIGKALIDTYNIE